MAENKSTAVIELANGYVSSVEEKHLAELCDEAERARKRADGCGCPQCRGLANRLEREFLVEYSRLYGYGSDHEEDWIWDQAGRKHFGEHWDDPVENDFDDNWPKNED